MKKISKYISIEKATKKTFDKVSQRVSYASSLKYHGKGVKIAIVDSGLPKHGDIKLKSERMSFCDDEASPYDNLGHSTMVSGIIGSNNKSAIVGVSPLSKLYFAKVVTSEEKCGFNSLVAGILWSIVKKVDIIVVSLGSKYDYNILHEVVKKAYDSNICVIASAGNRVKSEKDAIDYPARYKEVISVCSLPCVRTKKSVYDNLTKQVDISLPSKKYLTTYLDNKYIETSGSSLATAYVGGLAALCIERFKKEKVLYTPNKVKLEIKKSLINF